jgi:hypothetical protein
MKELSAPHGKSGERLTGNAYLYTWKSAEQTVSTAVARGKGYWIKDLPEFNEAQIL